MPERGRSSSGVYPGFIFFSCNRAANMLKFGQEIPYYEIDFAA